MKDSQTTWTPTHACINSIDVAVLIENEEDYFLEISDHNANYNSGSDISGLYEISWVDYDDFKEKNEEDPFEAHQDMIQFAAEKSEEREVEDLVSLKDLRDGESQDGYREDLVEKVYEELEAIKWSLETDLLEIANSEKGKTEIYNVYIDDYHFEDLESYGENWEDIIKKVEGIIEDTMSTYHPNFY